MTDVLHCKACGHALQIVCPEHGTAYVPDRRLEAAPVQPAVTVRQRRDPKPTTKRARILAALHDTEPRTPRQIAAAIGEDARHVGIDLNKLLTEGRVVRWGHGQYTRATP